MFGFDLIFFTSKRFLYFIAEKATVNYLSLCQALDASMPVIMMTNQLQLFNKVVVIITFFLVTVSESDTG